MLKSVDIYRAANMPVQKRRYTALATNKRQVKNNVA